MSERVVDRSETIEVRVHEREALLDSYAFRDQCREALRQEQPIGKSRKGVVMRGMLRSRQKVAGSDPEGNCAEARHSALALPDFRTLRRILERLSHRHAEPVQARLDGVVVRARPKRRIRRPGVPGHDDERQIQSSALDEREGLLGSKPGML